MFPKQGVLQKSKFSCSFQSISYNDVFLTKQICFSLTVLNSQIHISDNMASVIGTYSTTGGVIGIAWNYNTNNCSSHYSSTGIGRKR